MIKTPDGWNALEHAANLVSRRLGENFDARDLLQAILNTQPPPRLGVVVLGHQQVSRLGPNGVDDIGPLLRPVIYEVGDGYRAFVHDLIIAGVGTPMSIHSIDPDEHHKLYLPKETVNISAIVVPADVIESLIDKVGQSLQTGVGRSEEPLDNGTESVQLSAAAVPAEGTESPTLGMAARPGRTALRWSKEELAALLAESLKLRSEGHKAPTKHLAEKFGVSPKLIRDKLAIARRTAV